MVVGKNFLVFVCFRGHLTLFFLHESSSQLPGYPGSGLKCWLVVVWWGGSGSGV